MRYSILSLLGLLAGCATQIPNGVYQSPCLNNNSCTVRLYVGREEVPCVLAVKSAKEGALNFCQITSLGQDNYSMLLIGKTAQGNLEISRDMPQLHYVRTNRSLQMSSGRADDKSGQMLTMQFIPGSENKEFKPPWPLLPAQAALDEDDSPDLTLSDAELTKQQVGSWVVAPKDASYARGGFISVYHADGKLDGVGYKDVACTQPLVTVHGTWKIESGKLLLAVTDSSEPKLLAVGDNSTDTIMQVGNNKQVLKASDGTYQYRLKSTTCIAPKS